MVRQDLYATRFSISVIGKAKRVLDMIMRRNGIYKGSFWQKIKKGEGRKIFPDAAFFSLNLNDKPIFGQYAAEGRKYFLSK
jgi:hypothetical protein